MNEAPKFTAGQMTRIMLTRHGRGKELAELLRAELGVPDRVKWFEVRFDIDGPVTVMCEFMPTEKVADA